MLEAFKNFFVSLWNGFKKDIIYIAVIIVMVCWAITSMRACTNQVNENKLLEHNIEALSSEAELYKGKNGELVYQQQILIGDMNTLKIANENLYKRIKSMEVKNAEQALRIEGLIRNPQRDTVWQINNDTIYIDRNLNITRNFDFSDKWRTLNGNVFLADGNLGLNIDNDLIKFDYTAVFNDGQLYITSDNPYVQYNNITGIQVPKQRKKRWNLGIYGGFGVHYDISSKKIGYGPQIGAGISVGF
jgi:hypothetical protein